MTFARLKNGQLDTQDVEGNCPEHDLNLILTAILLCLNLADNIHE